MRKLIFAASVLAGAIFSITAQAGDKIRIGYWTSGVSLGYGSVLENKEFLKNRGIDAEFVRFPEVNAPIKALANGSIDVAFAAPLAGVFASVEEGVPLKIIAATQPADAQFVVPADSPIQSISELKGKKIGMSPAGSSMAVIAGAILEGNYGIKASEFSLVGGNESRLSQFLVQRQVDGAALRTGTVKQLAGELEVRSLGSYSSEWQKLTKSDAVPYIGVATATAKLVDEQPEVVARLLAGLKDTVVWGEANPEEVVKILQKAANLEEKDARVYTGQWKALNRVAFEEQDLNTLRHEHAVFLSSGVLKAPLKDDLLATGPYQQAKDIQ